MSEITYKGNQPVPPNTKRRRHASPLKVLLIIFLVIFIIIPGIIVGTIYACFYDNSHKDISHKEDYPNQEVFNAVLADSFNYTKTEHKARIRLTEENLNQLLYNSIKDLSSASGVIKNLYVDITDSSYDFVMEVNAIGIFQTRLILSTKLEIDDTNITFKISDVTLGRIHGMQNLLGFVQRFIQLPDLNEAFSGSGLNIKVDLASLSLTYAIEDFNNDIMKMVGDSEEIGSLLKEMLNNTELRSFIPYSSEAIELSLNLEKMRSTATTYGIEEYVIPNGYLTSYAYAASQKVNGYLDSSTITVEDAEEVTKYYTIGLDHLSDDEKTIVNGYLDASKIEEATDTYDFKVKEEDKIDYIASKQLAEQSDKIIALEDVTIELTTSQIDKIFKESDIFKTIMVFTGKGSDDHYKTNYIAINRMTSTIKDNNLFITISVDFNGYDINVTLKSVRDTSYSEEAAVRFVVDKMYLGDQAISDETTSVLTNLLTSTIETASFDGKFKMETDESGKIYITLNLKEAFGDDPIMSPLMSSFNFSYSSESNTKDTAGKMIFTASKK